MNKLNLIILVLTIITLTHNTNSEESKYIKSQTSHYLLISTIGQLVCIGGLGSIGYGFSKMNSTPKMIPIHNPFDTNIIMGYMELDNPKYTGRNFIIGGIIAFIGGTCLIVDSSIKLKRLKRIKFTTTNNGIQLTYLF